MSGAGDSRATSWTVAGVIVALVSLGFVVWDHRPTGGTGASPYQATPTSAATVAPSVAALPAPMPAETVPAAGATSARPAPTQIRPVHHTTTGPVAGAVRTSAAAKPTTAQAAPVSRPTTVYLADLRATQQTGCGQLSKSQQLLGDQTYYRSVAIRAETCTGGGNNYLEYALDPATKCSSLTLVEGIPNTDEADVKAFLEVDVDGQPVADGTAFTRGQSQKVTSPIRPSSIIRLVMRNLGGMFGWATGAFGDAKLSCRS